MISTNTLGCTALANVLSQANSTGGKPVFIKLDRYFKSDGGKCDVILIFKKTLYGQDKPTCL